MGMAIDFIHSSSLSFTSIDPLVAQSRLVPNGLVSVSVHPRRRSAVGITRDVGHRSRLCKVQPSRLRCTRCGVARRTCWHGSARGPLTQGPRGVRRTRSINPITGISRRYNGRAVATQCRCGSGLHRSTRAQGPGHRSKVWPSMCSSLRAVTWRSSVIDKAPRRGSASSLSASCQ